MLRVIELHVEALLKLIRKGFARRIVAIHVLVTNRAHGNIRRRELRQVTSGTRFVTGKAGTNGIVRPAMTIVTTNRSMFRTCVKEF